jgi:hypothetical protein
MQVVYGRCARLDVHKKTVSTQKRGGALMLFGADEQRVLRGSLRAFLQRAGRSSPVMFSGRSSDHIHLAKNDDEGATGVKSLYSYQR